MLPSGLNTMCPNSCVNARIGNSVAPSRPFSRAVVSSATLYITPTDVFEYISFCFGIYSGFSRFAAYAGAAKTDNATAAFSVFSSFNSLVSMNISYTSTRCGFISATAHYWQQYVVLI